MSSISTSSERLPTDAAYVGSSSEAFWKFYNDSRPSPPESLFETIVEYHIKHGDHHQRKLAHDVGTGPGNIAARIAAYFDHVVGTDLNESALKAAPTVVPPEVLSRIELIPSRAEEIVKNVPPEYGHNSTDMVSVGECMALLDPPLALKSFHAILQPGGTLAIYFYGRAVFLDGNADECNHLYDRIATRMFSFDRPIVGTPRLPFYKRTWDMLVSCFDNVEVPEEDWEAVERHKYDCDFPFMYCSKDAFDFDLEATSKIGKAETLYTDNSRREWSRSWRLEDVRSYMDSTCPGWRQKEGSDAGSIDKMFEDLGRAMGKEPRRITFPVVLILATKKGEK